MVSNRVWKDRCILLTFAGQRENLLDEARVHSAQNAKAFLEEHALMVVDICSCTCYESMNLPHNCEILLTMFLRGRSRRRGQL